MTIRCSICRLEPQKRAAIDAALSRGDISFQEVAERVGIHKSSIQRHAKHIKAPAAAAPTAEEFPPEPPAPVPPAPVPLAIRASAEPVHSPETPAPVVEVIQPGADTPAQPSATKAKLLERIEGLWGEVVDGLRAAREPLRLTRKDGATVELPAGDLRARAAFVREGRGVLELSGQATGDLKGAAVGPGCPVMIVIPAGLPRPEDIKTVMIGSRWDAPTVTTPQRSSQQPAPQPAEQSAAATAPASLDGRQHWPPWVKPVGH